MPSRTRLAISINGRRLYTGTSALVQLHMLCNVRYNVPRGLSLRERVKYIIEKHPGDETRFFLYREPKKTRKNKSIVQKFIREFDA